MISNPFGGRLFGGGRDANALRTSMLGPKRPTMSPPPGGIGGLPGAPAPTPVRPVVTPPPGGVGSLPGPVVPPPPRPIVGLPPIGPPQRPTPIAPIGPPQRPTPGMGSPILYHPSGAVWDYAMGDAAAGMRAGFLPRGGLLQQILLGPGQR